MHTVHNLHYSLDYVSIEIKSIERLYAVFIDDYEVTIFIRWSWKHIQMYLHLYLLKRDIFVLYLQRQQTKERGK